MTMVGFSGVTESFERPVKEPVPDRLAVCGPVLALTDKVPVLVPSAIGVKVTEIVQLDPAASVYGDRGQVDVCAKSPEVEIPEIVIGFDSMFFKVTVLAALVVVTTWLGNDTLVGEKLTAATPKPANGVVCGLLEALSLTVSVPLNDPKAEGVNVTEIVQLLRAPNVAGEMGQFEVCANSPEVEISEMVSGAVW